MVDRPPNESDLIERAKQNGARIVVPTGALIGLDAVRAAAEGDVADAQSADIDADRIEVIPEEAGDEDEERS